MPTYEMSNSAQERLLDEWFETTSFDAEFDGLPDDPDEKEEKQSDPFVEEKDGIRYVRTPEGAAHYGQPIGTPIVADGGAAANSTDLASVVAAAQANRGRVASAPSRRTRTRESGPDAAQGMANRWLPLWDDAEHAITPDNRYEIRAYRDGDKYTWVLNSLYAEATGGSASAVRREVDKGKSGTLANAKKAGERAFKQRSGVYQQRGLRDYDNIYDMWPGIPGLDFDPKTGKAPSKEMLDKYENDWDFRKNLANETTRAMGVRVDHHPDMDTEGFDPSSQEDINGVLMVFEEMYPGFNKVIDSIGVSSMSEFINKPYAYNATRRNRGGEMKFNSTQFGDWDDVQDAAARSLRPDAGTAWFVSNPDWVKQYDDYFNEAQVGRIHTTVHEIGHTIASIGLGLHVGITPPYPADGSRNEGLIAQEKASRERRQQFLIGLQDIFENWEVMKPERPADTNFDVEVDMSTSNRPFGWAPMTYFDRAALTEALSMYGATSLQEMFAEAWAEYMFDPDPRAFAIDVGDLMSDTLMEFLEAES